MKGIDYSWARPGGAAIKAAGFEFVMRYVPYPGDGGKGLDAAEAADLRANGLAIGLVFESTAGRMLGAWDAGVEDAHTCAAAIEYLGFPVLPIYFACDFDAQPDQYPALDKYLAGAQRVLGMNRVGVYGSYDVVEHCRDAGTAPWSWQTYAWSGGRVYAGNHVYQHLNGQELNGGAVDYNVGTGEGLWKVEDDMDEARIREIIHEELGWGTSPPQCTLESLNRWGNKLEAEQVVPWISALKLHMATPHASGPVPPHPHTVTVTLN